MLSGNGDIPGKLVVIDLEWLGNSHRPHKTHITELAAYCPANSTHFQTLVRPLAEGQCSADEQQLPVHAYASFVSWLQQQKNSAADCITLVAHNGIRYDMPVLVENMRRYEMSLPAGTTMLDSLHHFRYHLRHRPDMPANMSLDTLADLASITIKPGERHTALYDTYLLHNTLSALSDKFNLPYISGLAHPVCVSCMLVRGIGPTICYRLGVFQLSDLCNAILAEHGTLSSQACNTYLSSKLCGHALPHVNTLSISEAIQVAAQRYLHYLPSQAVGDAS